MKIQLTTFLAAVCFVPLLVRGEADSVSTFESHGDVGGPRREGAVEFDPARRSYVIAGGGENMWLAKDAFHFVWKKVSGDLTLAADVAFLGGGGDPHRKACLLIRQSLDSDSAYADAALHGDGLTSLQYRESKGSRTYEIQSSVTAPRRLRLEKRGKYISISIAREGEELHPAGGAFRLDLGESFYVGLGVCAHNNEALEKAVFTNVELVLGGGTGDPPKRHLISTLETVSLASKDRRAIYTTTDLIEAPNWARDGAALFFNKQGRIYRLGLSGDLPVAIDTGFATRCNNDHGLSPDGSTLVISDQSQQDRRSRIFTLPAVGGAPKLITEQGPSYWHGWSPDGKILAYCAERNGEFDIYTIPVTGGKEQRLTSAPGLDDGPDYTADGQWIYFNSERGGMMQIWRMRPDGTQQEQITDDEFNNWFPHPSPDGKLLVFLSYEKEEKGHPENKDVTLRTLTIADGKIEVLAKLFGGQGTINVPSWSPDSRRIAFVSYQLVP